MSLQTGLVCAMYYIMKVGGSSTQCGCGYISLAVLVPAGRLVKGSGSGDMDRTYWINSNELLVGETVVSQQSGVRLYDGEDRVSVK